MRKLRLWMVFLVVLLVAAPLSGGFSLAQDTYTLQYITSATGINYLGYLQGISGLTLSTFSDSGQVNVGFNNVTINGVYNRNIGLGSFRNQGTAAFVNIEPGQEVLPVTLSGQMFSQGNKVKVDNYNYAVNMNFNGFQGAGIVVMDVMAGSFCNQFTSLTFNMGKNATLPTPPTNVLSVVQGNPTTAVSLTNQQMKVIAATSDNDFQVQGNQSAVTTIQGTPNIQGISAITLSAGVNNQVSHNVGVNINTK